MTSFDSTLDLNQVKVVCSSIATLSGNESALVEAVKKLDKFGFIIIQCAPGQNVSDKEIRKNVLGLKPLFGTPAYHIRADKDGVCAVGTFEAVKAEHKAKMSKVKALNNEEFEPHTDASFQVKSDDFLSLTCYQPAKDGGESYVVSGAAIYSHIRSVLTPIQLEALFRPDAVTFKRGEETATKAVLRREETGRICITWRRDIIVDKMHEAVHPAAHVGVKAIDAFVSDRRNHVEHKLQRNEILVCNNAAVLHARHSFPDEQIRRLERLNFETIGSECHLDGLVKIGFVEEAVNPATIHKYDNLVAAAGPAGGCQRSFEGNSVSEPTVLSTMPTVEVLRG